MVALFHLTRLHFGRMIRSAWWLIPGLLAPIAAAGLALAGLTPPRTAVYAVLGVLAIAAAIMQAAGDRACGFSDGLRTSAAPGYSLAASRLTVIPMLFLLQIIVFAAAERAVALLTG
jgi:hypothetical protein